MNRSKRTALLARFRRALVDEALRDGFTLEQAEAYATSELATFRTPIIGKRVSNKYLRLAANEGR